MYYKSDFDLDLSTGQTGENTVQNLLNIETVEVKTDFMAAQTGNLAIEFESRGFQSGIAVTKAEYWAFLIPDKSLIMIKTDRLKELARKYFKKGSVVKGGDFNSSRIILIPIKEAVHG